MVKEIIDIGKNAFDLLKQALIGIILFFLVFFPASVGGALDRIGVSEGDIAGMKWKRELKATEKDLRKTDDALNTAQFDKDKLTKQLELANAEIKKQSELIMALESRAATPAEVSRTVKLGKVLIDENEKTITDAQKNLQAAQQVIVANSPRIAENSEWLVIAGSDPTEDGAKTEVRRAKQAGFNDTKLFKNRGAFRTAILYKDRQDAAEALPDVRTKMNRPDAYIVGYDKWCAIRTPRDGGVIECTSVDR